jgi:hypothetical protein
VRQLLDPQITQIAADGDAGAGVFGVSGVDARTAWKYDGDAGIQRPQLIANH